MTEAIAPARRLRVLLVGVGGQGVMTAGRLLGEAAMRSGRNVTVGQLHGMSQRGGSVESTVLLGPGRTAFVGAGEADVLLAFEPLEGVRARPRLAPGARVALNTGRLMPGALVKERTDYPDLDGLVRQIRDAAGEVHLLDAGAIATEAGEARAANTALLGFLGGLGWLPFEAAALREAIVERTPPGRREANGRAFDRGLAAAREAAGVGASKGAKG